MASSAAVVRQVLAQPWPLQACVADAQDLVRQCCCSRLRGQSHQIPEAAQTLLNHDLLVVAAVAVAACLRLGLGHEGSTAAVVLELTWLGLATILGIGSHTAVADGGSEV